jgi:hypothetical protein
VFLLSLIVVGGNLIVDFRYAIVDPPTTRGRDTVRVEATVGGVCERYRVTCRYTPCRPATWRDYASCGCEMRFLFLGSSAIDDAQL